MLNKKWYVSNGAVDCDDDVWRLVISTEETGLGKDVEFSCADTRVLGIDANDLEDSTATQETLEHIVGLHNAALER